MRTPRSSIGPATRRRRISRSRRPRGHRSIRTHADGSAGNGGQSLRLADPAGTQTPVDARLFTIPYDGSTAMALVLVPAADNAEMAATIKTAETELTELKLACRLQGHEVPPDRHRGRALRQDGHGRGQHAGRRDPARGRARHDRLRRMGRRHRGPAARAAHGLEIPLYAGHARKRLGRRACDQQGCLGQPAGSEPGGHEVGHDGNLRALVGELAETKCGGHRGVRDQARRQAADGPAGDQRGLSQDMGRVCCGRIRQEPVLQEGLRVRRRLMPPRWCRPSASCSRLTRRKPTTTSRRPRDKRDQKGGYGRPFAFPDGRDVCGPPADSRHSALARNSCAIAKFVAQSRGNVLPADREIR